MQVFRARPLGEAPGGSDARLGQGRQPPHATPSRDRLYLGVGRVGQPESRGQARGSAARVGSLGCRPERRRKGAFDGGRGEGRQCSEAGAVHVRGSGAGCTAVATGSRAARVMCRRGRQAAKRGCGVGWEWYGSARTLKSHHERGCFKAGRGGGVAARRRPVGQGPGGARAVCAGLLPCAAGGRGWRAVECCCA